MRELYTAGDVYGDKINLCSLFAAFYANYEGRTKRGGVGDLWVEVKRGSPYLSQRK